MVFIFSVIRRHVHLQCRQSTAMRNKMGMRKVHGILEVPEESDCSVITIHDHNLKIEKSRKEDQDERDISPGKEMILTGLKIGNGRLRK
ncbi:hypothetical protein T12_13983, partial [Trichinella patagoniensis]